MNSVTMPSQPARPDADLDGDTDRTRVPREALDEAACLRERGAGAAPALPAGTRLAEFEVLDVLGQGGFSIVYLAFDHSLGRRVALKEYLPAPLAAARAPGSLRVQMAGGEAGEAFALGLRSFVNEAHLLAHFDHPALAKVHRFWQANDTAYMVMPLYEGITLKAHLRALGEPPGEAWLLALLDPLTDALAALHAEHCLHRDVAPDNILLRSDDRPLLLDFGAARQVVADATHALTAILKPGYAPVEQYADMPDLAQGPWTDVYALAAVVHTAIAGHAPPPSVSRLVRDTCAPLAEAAAGRYSTGFLQAIDRALAVQPRARPQSMAELREALGLARLPSRRAASLPFVPPAAAAPPAHGPAPSAPGAGAAQAPQAARRPSLRRGLGIAAFGLAAAAIGGALFFLRAPEPAATAPTGAAMGDVDRRAAAPQAAAAERATPALPQAASPMPAAAPATEAPPAAVTSAFAPPGVAAAFERLLQAQDSGFGVAAQAAQARLRVDRDPLRFSVSSAREGHVYVLLHGPDDSLLLLFPNRAARDNRIRAGQTLRLPQAAWPLVARAPLGSERFLVVVTPAPRDLGPIALGHAGDFARLPTDERLGELARALGSAYGAATFRVDVVP
jgi:hypothetical protein